MKTTTHVLSTLTAAIALSITPLSADVADAMNIEKASQKVFGQLAKEKLVPQSGTWEGNIKEAYVSDECSKEDKERIEMFKSESHTMKLNFTDPFHPKQIFGPHMQAKWENSKPNYWAGSHQTDDKNALFLYDVGIISKTKIVMRNTSRERTSKGICVIDRLSILTYKSK